MSKKVYFVCAPVFLYWPVAISKKLQEIHPKESLLFGGFIGGPVKYHEILKQEWGSSADQVIYTHDLEELWLNTPYSKEKLDHFISLFGHKALNELIIADRQVGYGYLSGGGISEAKILKKIKESKESHLNYIVGMLDYLENFFEQNRPNVLYSYAVAGAFTLAIGLFADKLNFTFLKLTHSRFGDRVVIDTCPVDSMNIVREKFLDSNYKFSDESILFSKQYLNDFRKKQSQPEYQTLQNQVYKSKTEFKNQLKLYVKKCKGLLSSKNDYFQGSYAANVAYEQKTVKGIKEFWKKRPFYPKEQLLSKPFFFYTLHVDPEASTMVVSPYQTNQFAVIEAIAKSKPIDHILVVKEHVTMIGRRPKDFYEKINALPGVYMIDPTASSFPFIRQAKAIITITGTSGLEAIMLKKPAVFLGKFIYEFIQKGFASTTDLSDLSSILTNIEDITPADDDTLHRLLMCAYESSFSFNSSLIWSGVSKEKVEQNSQAVASFANAIQNYL